MPTISPIQTGFNAGEISGAAAGRTDLPFFKLGLSYCSNFNPKPQGSLLMRAGSEMMQKLVGADDRVRLLQFRMANGQDYIVALLDKRMKIYSVNGGQVGAVAVGETELLVNGDFSLASGQGWEGWRYDLGWFNATSIPGDANTTTSFYSQGQRGYCRLSRPPADILGRLKLCTVIRQKVTVVAASVLRLRGKVIGGQSTLGINVFSHAPVADEDGDVLSMHNVEPLNTVFEYTTKTLAPGDYWVTLVGYNFGIDIDDLHVAALAAGGVSFDLITPWSASEVRQIQLASEPSSNRAFFVHPKYTPYFLKFNSSGAWDFNALVLAGAPTEWGTGAGKLGWPETVEVYDSRVYFAIGNHWWASRVGVFDNSGGLDMTTATGPVVDGKPTTLPSDGMDYKVATKGLIRWIKGARKLLIGTDLEEHSVSASNGTLMPGDAYAKRESGFGSCDSVQAVDAGSKVLYVSADCRKVRSLFYDNDTNGWESKDLTFWAEHMTEGLVRELHYTFNPEGMLIALLESGEVIACSFTPGEGIAAWWRLALVSGQVCSSAVSRGPAGAYLWLAMLRNGDVYLERVPLSDSPTNGYLDAATRATSPIYNEWKAGVVYDFDARVVWRGRLYASVTTGPDVNLPPNVSAQWVTYDDLAASYVSSAWVNVEQGLMAMYNCEHLNGMDVMAVLDGAMAGPFQVQDGRIELPSAASAVVGLSYRARAVTLPIEGGNPGGTSQGFKTHWPEIAVRVNKSAAPLVNGKRAGNGRPFGTLLDQAQPLTTGDLKVSNLGINEGGIIEILQDLPLRTEICAIYGQAAISKT